MPELNQTAPDESQTGELTRDLIEKVTEKVLKLLKEDLRTARERKRFSAHRKTGIKGTR